MLGWSGRQLVLAGEHEKGRDRAEQALSIAEAFDLVDLQVHALTTIGTAKEFSGDTTGRTDIEHAVEIGRAANSAMVAGALNNLAVVIDHTDMRRVEQLRRRSAYAAPSASEMRRSCASSTGTRSARIWILGQWDEAIATADRFIAECRGVATRAGGDRIASSGAT